MEAYSDYTEASSEETEDYLDEAEACHEDTEARSEAGKAWKC